ncbi:transferase [Dermatophagoides farinae]|uniref:UDP-N-acetylglucosamine transferase subunit ALG13 n=1 Tax=Dermatophagoides farinae TaxID=6954 RepID=A0A922I7W0_DERFA|nr:UDP-N-acetylglucosamine transferase subunit alg13-like [Dermatophagoides farinae]KAH7639643.1 udp-n-acetylglucosamine transferase subunit alg13-like protein [Dermatophagoides farinae]KAH9521639.1 transferase [Dermatophagoides farinae]
MKEKFQKIFITVGTTRFDRLIESLLLPNVISALHEIGCKQLTIQYGRYHDLDQLNLFQMLPGIKVNLFDYSKSFSNHIHDADLVIGHAGAGTVLEVLRMNKPLLIVINDDLMDNHQQELADELVENNYVKCTDIENFVQTLRKFETKNLQQFPQHDPLLFRNFIQNLSTMEIKS